MSSAAGADPGGVRWVRTNPSSSLQYQLFLRAELILGCKHTENSIAAGWDRDSWPTRGSVGPATGATPLV